MLISDVDLALNRQLHENCDGYGRSGAKWADQIANVIETDGGYASILDFGCGKSTLAAALAAKSIAIAEYDPAIPGKDAAPEAAELVICGDVLEHVALDCLDAVITELRRLATRKLIVVIDTGPAKKMLADGRNAHLIIEDASWWGGKLSQAFDVLEWRILGRKIYGELAPKLPGRLPAKRRTAPEEWAIQTEAAKAQFNRYADAFSRVETINMWEGVGDVVADMQVAVWIVEHMPDIAAALHNIACLSCKATFFVIDLSAGHEERYWRQMLEQRFRIYDARVVDGVLNVICAPKLSHQGLKAVGVVSAEDRWEQTKVAIKRISGRVAARDAHDRIAVLACYGPSLALTVDDLAIEAKAAKADVVSVSGAHDYLLSHEIAAQFHVECDPRAHKADNIAKYHSGTRYLLASCVHEALFDKLGPEADIALWHIASSQHSVELIDKLREDPRIVITGGGSVGLRAISLLYAMGYRRLSIHGMDCSFSDDSHEQHAGKHAGEKQQMVTYSCGGKMFYTSHILKTYATDFLEMIQRVGDIDITLHGHGLLQTMVTNMETLKS